MVYRCPTMSGKPWLLILLAASSAASQTPTRRISFAVDIQDSTNQFPSAFAAALRQLGDVEVVPVTERPDYVLSGVAMCQPDCGQLTRYVVSLRLYSPMQRSASMMLAGIALRRSRPVAPQVRDTIESELWRRLYYYEFTLGTWVAAWGRNRYEQEIREFVRMIDSSCLERVRSERRALGSDDSAAFGRYQLFENSRRWIC